MTQQIVTKEGVTLQQNDVAEWVGLHYGRNFDAESSEKKMEWAERYAQAHELVADDVQEVIDDVLERGKKYGFQQDEDSVRGAVDESSNLLGITLSEAQIVQACDLVLEVQASEVERQR